MCVRKCVFKRIIHITRKKRKKLTKIDLLLCIMYCIMIIKAIFSR